MIKLQQICTNSCKFLQLYCWQPHAGWGCVQAFLKHLTELYLLFPHCSSFVSAALHCRVRCCLFESNIKPWWPCRMSPCTNSVIIANWVWSMRPWTQINCIFFRVKWLAHTWLSVLRAIKKVLTHQSIRNSKYSTVCSIYNLLWKSLQHLIIAFWWPVWRILNRKAVLFLVFRLFPFSLYIQKEEENDSSDC